MLIFLSLMTICLSSWEQRQVTKLVIYKLNEIILNSMPNGWSKQAFVQGFDPETITFLKSVNMFENMENFETIYE